MDIFRPDPKIDDDDRARLGHWLGNYGRLNEGLVLGNFTIEDLQRLVLLEKEGAGRKAVLRRLVGRIVSAERRRIWKAAIGEEAP